MKYDGIIPLHATAEKRIAILGHNGSGKTTIISILLGLLKPDGGNIAINGVKPYKKYRGIHAY